MFHGARSLQSQIYGVVKLAEICSFYLHYCYFCIGRADRYKGAKYPLCIGDTSLLRNRGTPQFMRWSIIQGIVILFRACNLTFSVDTIGVCAAFSFSRCFYKMKNILTVPGLPHYGGTSKVLLVSFLGLLLQINLIACSDFIDLALQCGGSSFL